MNQVCIRRMQTLDIEAVLKVEQASFSTPWSQQAFESEMKNELTCYLVLCEDKKVIGYAGMWIIVDEAHVTNVAVLPAYRGRGLGEKLMFALKETAAARGAVSMTLEVRPSNQTAQNLYEKLGFVRCGARRNYYADTSEDAVIMWCHHL